MKLKEIRLKNFRCYEDLAIPLNENLTVLVAPNGQGKTSILDAISIALWDFVKGFDLAKSSVAYNIGIDKDDVRIVKHADKDEMIRQLPTQIIGIDDTGFSWMRYRDSEAIRSHTKADENANLLQKRAKAIQKAIRDTPADEKDLPLFAYYGTGRLWSEKRLMNKQKQNKNDVKIRTFAYQNSLDPASSYKQFEDWFARKYMQLIREVSIAWEKGEKDPKGYSQLKSEILNIRQSINIVLDVVGWQNPEYSEIFDKKIVLTHKQYGTLKLDQLSDGIQNVFALVADIAYRCYLLNSHLGENAAKETKGIVLIDEVDMHLHPEWQQVILRDLQSAFPNLQFIVTTHSPQVLSTVKKDQIRIVDNGVLVEVMSNTYGEISSDVMHRVQGVDPRPPIAERDDLNRLDQWVSEGRYEENDVQELLKQLIEKVGLDNETILRTKRSIERQKILADMMQRRGK